MKRILFVCTGNVFRSMSAEFLMKKYIEDNRIKDVLVSSAGTSAKEWNYPYTETVERLQHYDVDPTRHIPQRVTHDMVDNVDIIICMTKDHQKKIMERFGKESVLFNKIAHGVDENLYDEDEYGRLYGFDFDLKTYIYDTVDHIKNSIPLVYAKIQ